MKYFDFFQRNNRWRSIVLVFSGVSIFAVSAWPQMTRSAKIIGTLNNVVYTGQAMEGASQFTMKIHTSCYGTNLRSTSNPLSPFAKVTMGMKIKDSSNAVKDVTIKFPASIVSNNAEDCDTRKSLCKPTLRDACYIIDYFTNYEDVKAAYPAVYDVAKQAASCSSATDDDLVNSATLNGQIKTVMKYIHDYPGFESSALPIYYDNLDEQKCFSDFKSDCTQSSGTSQPVANVNVEISGLPNARAGIFSNYILIYSDFVASSAYSNSSERDGVLDSINFSQKIPPGTVTGDHQGSDGSLSYYTSSKKLTNDGKQLELYVSFPGQSVGTWVHEGQATGFCGGFYSPLMLFFDDKRPLFDNKSHFKIYPNTNMPLIYWPEKNHPGYFLAIDKTGKRQVKDGASLFSDGPNFKNGFEALRALDSNHDGIIDKKDADFKYLFLWNDKNGNGVAEIKSETFSLAEKKVKWISLKYNENVQKDYGNRAKEKGVSEFGVLDKKGTLIKHKIIDIWFSPVDNSN